MPRVSASYIRSMARGFGEENGGAAAVRIDDFVFTTLKTRESFRFGKDNAFSLHDIKISPYLEFGLAQEKAINGRNISGSFSNSARFSTRLEKNNRDFITSAIGLNAQINKTISAFLNKK